MPSEILYLGCCLAPLVYVEVIPLETEQRRSSENDYTRRRRLSLSAPIVKQRLRRKSLYSTVSRIGSTRMFVTDGTRAADTAGDSHVLMRGTISVPTTTNDDCPHYAHLARSRQVEPIVYIPSEDPGVMDPIPCFIVGYGFPKSFESDKEVQVIIADSTLVQVLPAEPAIIFSKMPQKLDSIAINSFPFRTISDWELIMTGELSHPPLSDEMIDEVFHNHDLEAIESLSLRMSLLLSQSVRIGTTADAIVSRRKRQSRSTHIKDALNAYARSGGSNSDRHAMESPKGQAIGDSTSSPSAKDKVPAVLREGALVVYSPDHGAGKTLLVRAIAQERLACEAIHIVQPTSLFARFGIHADTALESLLHSIVIRAACQQKSICIILDQIDAMLPPLSSSGSVSFGDAAMPVVKAVASYLRSLTLGLKRNGEFQFPTKNALYNVSGTNGLVFDTNVCLVGVMTCDDSRKGSIEHDALGGMDTLVAGRYRLPSLCAKGRLVAFQRTFERANISLCNEAVSQLPFLAASAVDSRGRVFSDVARCLAKVSKRKEASLQELKAAFSIRQRGMSSLSKVEFTGNESVVDNGLFASVGGNAEAKRAIEEALALDPGKRRILRRFGLSPPIGLLLYGPPGCGKTLLAKSVSRLLSSQKGNDSLVGGSFITLQASEIVRGEVGNSEKAVVSAFETARSNAPSVIFIDEFQALFTERSGRSSGKLSSILLQCMDDVCRWRDADDDSYSDFSPVEEKEESGRVVVMGATNTPWMVDKAFLRPGRFDRVVHVGLPTREERVSILHVHVSRMQLASNESSDVHRICQELAELCDDFSGADLAALCRATAVRCLAELGADGRIQDCHFFQALDGLKPSCNGELANRLNAWKP